MSPPRVAVVGAGLAGLTAARALQDGGLRVTVFDKARGVGGRTATRRIEGGAFDHGAQYFTCRDERFERQVAAWSARGVIAEWRGRLAVLSAGETRPVAPGPARYVGVPGMNALAKDLATGLSVVLRCEVEAIEAGREGWSLHCADGERLAGFDAVVVATPAPQAVPLLTGMPKLAAEAAGVPMLPCQAAMVRFDEPPTLAFDGAFVEGSPLGWVAGGTSRPGRAAVATWVLHATPGWSERHLEDRPELVAARLLRAFEEALGDRLPAPDHLVGHRWRFARSSAPLNGAVLWDPESRAGVCGDWTCGDRVEGAFTSGRRLAQTLLAWAG